MATNTFILGNCAFTEHVDEKVIDLVSLSFPDNIGTNGSAV